MTVAEDIQSRRNELNLQLQGKQDTIEGFATNALKMEGDKFVVDATHLETGRKVMGEAEEIKALLIDLDRVEGLTDYMTAPAGQTAADKAASEFRTEARKSLGELFGESDALKEFRSNATRAGFSRSFSADDVNIKSLMAAAEQKDLYTALGGNFTAPAFGTREGPDIIPRRHRTTRVRDLFGPPQSTSSNLIEFIRVSGFTNNARPVPQREDATGAPVVGIGGVNFGLKPSSDLAFTTGLAPVRTIAHNIRVHKSTLDDEPRLRGIIDGEMLYGLQLAEDIQLLSGDGTGENVMGLLNTVGLQQYTQRNNAAAPPVATERKSDSIRRAATLVMLAYYEPTGVVLHPFDWEDIELERSTQGLYLVSVSVAVGAEQRLWRMPVTSTPAIAQGTFLVGAFGLGAQVWDRQQANVILSTEDRDNVVRNAVTIQAEERVALEVSRPESFVQGHLYGEPAQG